GFEKMSLCRTQVAARKRNPMSDARPLTEPRADEALDRIAWLREASEKLQSLLHLSRGWDSYEADPPNEGAIRRAEQVLTAVNSTRYRPDRIVPSIALHASPRGAHGMGLGTREWDPAARHP